MAAPSPAARSAPQGQVAPGPAAVLAEAPGAAAPALASPPEGAHGTTAPASVAPSPPGSRQALMLEALARAVRQTPFSAVVQHQRVDVLPFSADERKHVYQVRVLQRIRGPQLQALSYSLVAEKGEKPTLSREPVIVTLCKSAEGYYWPGVGSKFPRTPETLAVIDRIKPELSDTQGTFTDCD